MNYHTAIISAEGFRYHIKNGQLLKGSTISKKTHPINDVEIFKKSLIEHKKVKDIGSYFSLKDTIEVGLEMAINLHFGELYKENPIKQDIYVPESETEYWKNQLPQKGYVNEQSELYTKVYRDSFRLKSIYRSFFDFVFFQSHKDSELEPNKVESFIFNIFKEKGIISDNSRHGNAQLNEADIIDEDSHSQYEIIYENKLSFSNRRKNNLYYNNIDFLILNHTNNVLIHISDALIKKFTEKTYTDFYKLKLIIFTFGDYATTRSFVDVLGTRLQTLKIKNDYQDIYIVSYDCLSEPGSVWILSMNPFSSTEYECDNESIGFSKKEAVSFNEMENDKEYLLILENIFSGIQCVRYCTGNDIRRMFRDFRIQTDERSINCQS